eukprot:8650105-Alexandrium_andersonii.AAC.1
MDLGRAAEAERAGSGPARELLAPAVLGAAAAAAAASPLAERRSKIGASGMTAGSSRWRAWGA